MGTASKRQLGSINVYETKETGGRFERKAPQFRNWITADGSAGPSGDAGFVAEAGRYHLYVSYACPWAHRTLIYRALKGLEDMISVSVVHWYMAEGGWTFNDGDGCHQGQCQRGEEFLRDLRCRSRKLFGPGNRTSVVGASKPMRSSPMNHLKLFACSMERLTQLAPEPVTIIPPISVRR